MLCDRTFSECVALRRVTFREGSRLTEIGDGCFSRSGVQEIEIPRGVTTICRGAFSECGALRRVTFREGSRLEKIGRECFSKSGIAEVEVPKLLKTIGSNAFLGCEELRTIRVGENLNASLSCTGISASVEVVLLQGTTAWVRPLLELGKLKEIVVPDGTERIGSYWFWRSGIERVTVPASVAEVGTEAFCGCERLV